MEITQAMMRAARHAAFEHHQLNRGKHDRFKPLPDSLIRAILDAAISAIEMEDEPEPVQKPAIDEKVEKPRIVPRTKIVTARKPRPRR